MEPKTPQKENKKAKKSIKLKFLKHLSPSGGSKKDSPAKPTRGAGTRKANDIVVNEKSKIVRWAKGCISEGVVERVCGAMYHVEQHLEKLDLDQIYQSRNTIDSRHVRACEYLLIEGKDPSNIRLHIDDNKKIGSDIYAVAESIRGALEKHDPLVPQALARPFMSVTNGDDLALLMDSNEWPLQASKLMTTLLVHVAKICYFDSPGEQAERRLLALANLFGSILVRSSSVTGSDDSVFLPCPIKGKMIVMLVKYIQEDLHGKSDPLGREPVSTPPRETADKRSSVPSTKDDEHPTSEDSGFESDSSQNSSNSRESSNTSLCNEARRRLEESRDVLKQLNIALTESSKIS
jgi:hypothetical protein